MPRRGPVAQDLMTVTAPPSGLFDNPREYLALFLCTVSSGHPFYGAGFGNRALVASVYVDGTFDHDVAEIGGTLSTQLETPETDVGYIRDTCFCVGGEVYWIGVQRASSPTSPKNCIKRWVPSTNAFSAQRADTNKPEFRYPCFSSADSLIYAIGKDPAEFSSTYDLLSLPTDLGLPSWVRGLASSSYTNPGTGIWADADNIYWLNRSGTDWGIEKLPLNGSAQTRTSLGAIFSSDPPFGRTPGCHMPSGKVFYPGNGTGAIGGVAVRGLLLDDSTVSAIWAAKPALGSYSSDRKVTATAVDQYVVQYARTGAATQHCYVGEEGDESDAWTVDFEVDRRTVATYSTESPIAFFPIV
jgi:hypothetical protein